MLASFGKRWASCTCWIKEDDSANCSPVLRQPSGEWLPQFVDFSAGGNQHFLRDTNGPWFPSWSLVQWADSLGPGANRRLPADAEETKLRIPLKWGGPILSIPAGAGCHWHSSNLWSLPKVQAAGNPIFWNVCFGYRSASFCGAEEKRRLLVDKPTLYICESQSMIINNLLS